MRRISKWVLTIPASLAVFYLGNRYVSLYQVHSSEGLGKAAEVFRSLPGHLLELPLYIDTGQNSLLGGLVAVLLLWAVVLYQMVFRKNFMHGIEHGSAKWGTAGTIRPFLDKKEDQNIILTATEGLMLKRNPRPELDRNKNVMVIGSPGSGKTRFWVKPNFLQLHSSFVGTDSKGTLFQECGQMFADAGYKIKVFNLKEMGESDHYNPFHYIREEKDILSVVNTIMVNTDQGKETKEDFWVKSERMFLQALFAYVYYEADAAERHMGTVLDLLRLAKASESDENYQSPLDILFADLKAENPDHFACVQYDLYKMAAGETAKSILISVGVRLSPFYIDSVRKLMERDTLELSRLGEEKTALFVILPDTDKTFNFIAAMMYQQMFQTLVYQADSSPGGRLPVHVRIPDFKELIATIRSREISVSIILQTLTQLKSMYKDSWGDIVGCCSSLVFLGGQEQATVEFLSKQIGKTTVDNQNINETKGTQGSWSRQAQILGRELITIDELTRLRGDECILLLEGVLPFRSKKYDLRKHPRYKMLAESGDGAPFRFADKQKDDKLQFFKGVTEIRELEYALEINQLS